jgi:hypothetical protein
MVGQGRRSGDHRQLAHAQNMDPIVHVARRELQSVIGAVEFGSHSRHAMSVLGTGNLGSHPDSPAPLVADACVFSTQTLSSRET